MPRGVPACYLPGGSEAGRVADGRIGDRNQIVDRRDLVDRRFSIPYSLSQPSTGHRA